MLVLRFRPLDVGQLERFVESRRAGRVSELGESIDAMATCCIGVFGRDGDRLIDLNVGLDNRLAELLAWPVPPDAKLSTREVIIKLFGGEAFPLGAFVDDLAAWMSNPDGNGQPPGES